MEFLGINSGRFGQKGKEQIPDHFGAFLINNKKILFFSCTIQKKVVTLRRIF